MEQRDVVPDRLELARLLDYVRAAGLKADCKALALAEVLMMTTLVDVLIMTTLVEVLMM